MHGRLKVKTTAEQQEEKRIEREQKLVLFQKGCSIVQQKRDDNEQTEDTLTLIARILQANPDYYTMWNFRKEILLHLKTLRSQEEFEKICLNEMYLTEACIRKNPKSYGSWNHRSWILTLSSIADWSKEILMCNKFLEADERNFHGWDYRRFVCKLMKASPSEELDFTMIKIEENFSNYSAWHYRSSLLPLVHPNEDKSRGGAVAEEILLKEYEMVQNAAFTDPSDQSAWLYHRWLLGRAERKLGLLYSYVSIEHKVLVAVFTKPIRLDKSNILEITIDSKEISSEWRPAYQTSYATSTWVCDNLSSTISSGNLVNLTLSYVGGFDKFEFEMKSNIIIWNKTSRKKLYSSEMSVATEDVLKQELDSCEQLLEMEPDNKWTLLTCILLMQALDNQNFANRVFEYIDKLVTVDQTRSRYYEDLKSKYFVENTIECLHDSDTVLNINGKKITSLPHLDHMTNVTELDISNNSIQSFANFGSLVFLSKLNVDNNSIQRCSGLEDLLFLEEVSLVNNNLRSYCDFECLKKSKSLKILKVNGNPITQNIDEFNILIHELNNVKICQ